MRPRHVVPTLILSLLHGWLACSSFARADDWVVAPKEKISGLTHRTFRSSSMGRDVGYNIYLPSDYGKSERRFPVVYFLHQLGSNESTLLITIRTLDQAIKQKKVAPSGPAATNSLHRQGLLSGTHRSSRRRGVSWRCCLCQDVVLTARA
jgi:hypothetical protein